MVDMQILKGSDADLAVSFFSSSFLPPFQFFPSIGSVFQDLRQYSGHQWRSVLLPGPLFALGLPACSERPPFVWENHGQRKQR